MDFSAQGVTTIATILIAVCALAIAVVGRAALDPYTRDWDRDVEPLTRVVPANISVPYRLIREPALATSERTIDGGAKALVTPRIPTGRHPRFN